MNIEHHQYEMWPQAHRNGAAHRISASHVAPVRAQRGTTRWPFPGLIYVLIGMNMIIVGVTVYFATTDRSFAVEPDYYQKAMHWDQSALQRERNRALAWHATLAPMQAGQPIALRLGDATNRPIGGASVQAVAFHNAEASNRLTTTLGEIEPGLYRSSEVLTRNGSWEVRITARVGPEVFTSTLPLEVAGPAQAPAEASKPEAGVP